MCGKVCYPSRKEAKAALARRKENTLLQAYGRVYWCAPCAAFHFGKDGRRAKDKRCNVDRKAEITRLRLREAAELDA